MFHWRRLALTNFAVNCMHRCPLPGTIKMKSRLVSVTVMWACGGTDHVNQTAIVKMNDVSGGTTHTPMSSIRTFISFPYEGWADLCLKGQGTYADFIVLCQRQGLMQNGVPMTSGTLPYWNVEFKAQHQEEYQNHGMSHIHGLPHTSSRQVVWYITNYVCRSEQHRPPFSETETRG